MEHSQQTQITDHSSERIESEVMELCDHPDDDLTAILKAKDEQIKRLQLGNLCFMKRANFLEGKVKDFESALEEARDRIGVINHIFSVMPTAGLSPQQLQGMFFVVGCLADEAESTIDHDLAIANLPCEVNPDSDSED